MSTAVLSPERFGDISASLVHYSTNEANALSASALNGALADAMRASPFDPERTAATARALVFDWQRLNAAAYANCYAGRFGTPTTVPPCGGSVLSLIALLKALRCLRYNCNHGRDHADSLRTLDALIAALTEQIITTLPEFEAADWF